VYAEPPRSTWPACCLALGLAQACCGYTCDHASAKASCAFLPSAYAVHIQARFAASRARELAKNTCIAAGCCLCLLLLLLSADTLWVEKYKPKTSQDLVGNQSNVQSLRQWLHQWEDVHLRGATPVQPRTGGYQVRGAWCLTVYSRQRGHVWE
jgi:hypothetical protein